MIDAKQAQEVALFIRAGGGKNFRAKIFGQLDGGNADAAGSAVNKNFFTLAQTGEMVQRVVAGEEGAGNGSGGFERYARRNPRYAAGLGEYMVAKARWAERDDAMANSDLHATPS